MELTAKQFHKATEEGRKYFQEILPADMSLERGLARLAEITEGDLSEAIITEVTAIVAWSAKNDCWREIIGCMGAFDKKHGDTIEKLREQAIKQKLEGEEIPGVKLHEEELKTTYKKHWEVVQGKLKEEEIDHWIFREAVIRPDSRSGIDVYYSNPEDRRESVLIELDKEGNIERFRRLTLMLMGG